MAEELKACPFCGGEPNLTHSDYVHDDLRQMPVVECKSCSAWVRAEDWNRRTMPSQGGEAAAWMLADAVGGSMLEFQRDLLLENQCRYGGEIVPLYTHPADQVAEGVAVSRELLVRLFKADADVDREGSASSTLYAIARYDGAMSELRARLAKSEGVKK